MSCHADYFASINANGEITMITHATPSHELTENQVMLTFEEYKLLSNVRSVEEAYKLLGSIGMKIEKRLNEASK